MGFVVRKPGTPVEVDLDELDVTAVFRVPDSEVGDAVVNAALAIEKRPETFSKHARRVLGLLLVELRNVEVAREDGSTTRETIEARVERGGDLERDVFDQIYPIRHRLVAEAVNLCVTKAQDAKNC